MDKKPKPEWIIYKNDQRIGQAVTWHRALAILMEQEKLAWFSVFMYAGYLVIETKEFSNNRYRIQKERG